MDREITLVVCSTANTLPETEKERDRQKDIHRERDRQTERERQRGGRREGRKRQIEEESRRERQREIDRYKPLSSSGRTVVSGERKRDRQAETEIDKETDLCKYNMYSKRDQ